MTPAAIVAPRAGRDAKRIGLNRGSDFASCADRLAARLVVSARRGHVTSNSRFAAGCPRFLEQMILAENCCRQYRLRTARSHRLDSSVCAAAQHRLFTDVRSKLSELRRARTAADECKRRADLRARRAQGAAKGTALVRVRPFCGHTDRRHSGRLRRGARLETVRARHFGSLPMRLRLPNPGYKIPSGIRCEVAFRR